MPLKHVDPRTPRGAIYKAWTRLQGTRFAGWISRHIGWKLDPILMRISGGRIGAGVILPTALLETRGARTGKLRRNVLIYFHDGDRPTLMASHLGLPTHPSWFYNLKANPDVTFGGEPFRAMIVEDEAERTRLWSLADLVFPPYAAYRQQAAAAGRTIPIVQMLPA